MKVAVVNSRCCIGVEAPEVKVEVHISRGLPKFKVVGLAATIVKESKDRVRSAILTAGFDFPLQYITVNLSPADLPKQSGCFDLPMALAILIATQQIKVDLTDYEIVGELSLTGEVQKIPGALPILIAAGKAGRKIIIPDANAFQASWVAKGEIYPAKCIVQIIHHLNKKELIAPCAQKEVLRFAKPSFDMAEVQGQAAAKRALEIAAAGRHHVLMVGAPGVGKSMLAARMITIIPPLEIAEAQSVAAIHMQHSNIFHENSWRVPPFRAPHHTISTVALMGGGQVAMPGEISLAHNGVLFLDEWAEFPRPAKEALREPLSTGVVNIARAQYRINYPANFQLIAAMNPCPCGYFQDGTSRCRCTSEQILRYQAKISGPLLDRIDIKLRIAAPPASLLLKPKVQEDSASILQRVIAARTRQYQRFGKLNSMLSENEINSCINNNDSLQQTITDWAECNNASLRSINKIIKVARTIADLEHSEQLEQEHLLEALGYYS
jgi:magnesium chelatase family protein